ncbi:MAG: alpha/beta fold hydrolase [Candidatus Nanopelagicales bacterium]
MDSRRPERLHRRWRRAAGWLLLAIAVTLPGSVAAAAPAPAPAVSDARAELIQRTPAPGRLIQVAGLGHQHLWCRGPIPGPTTPTVVVISGAGDFSLSWRQVQSRLASHNRVCTYDRAGLGWSATGPSPRTGATIVDELTDLLAAGDIHGPLVMVGHSMGGIYARMFAARHPARVRAVALIDPGDERLDVTVPAAERAGMRAGTAAAVTRQLASGRQCTADVLCPRPVTTASRGGPPVARRANLPSVAGCPMPNVAHGSRGGPGSGHDLEASAPARPRSGFTGTSTRRGAGQ